MKRGLIIGIAITITILIFLVILFYPADDNKNFGSYLPNKELQQAEPLMADLPSINYIDSIINTDYKGKYISVIAIHSNANGPQLTIEAEENKGDFVIDFEKFVLPYTESLDAVIMPKRVEWRQFAGVPFYRVENGYEAENVNASGREPTPFILTKSLLVQYIESIYGKDCEYSIKHNGANYIVVIHTTSGMHSFIINSLSFEQRDI